MNKIRKSSQTRKTKILKEKSINLKNSKTSSRSKKSVEKPKRNFIKKYFEIPENIK